MTVQGLHSIHSDTNTPNKYAVLSHSNTEYAVDSDTANDSEYAVDSDTANDSASDNNVNVYLMEGVCACYAVVLQEGPAVHNT